MDEVSIETPPVENHSEIPIETDKMETDTNNTASESKESVPNRSELNMLEPNKSGKENTPPEKPKLVRLPLARIKHIMKMDPECEIVATEAVFLVTKATELFLECLSKEAVKMTGKRKTLMKKDVEAAIDSIPNLCFLEGILEDL